VALAALEEDAVSLNEKIHDTGRWYYPDVIAGSGPWGWNCWKGGGHGKISISEAITVSCNYFFYELGYRLGIDALTDYAKAFGLGTSTGIEIGDRAGTLAGPESREAAGGVWYGGDVVQAAIGQSDNLFTPIQLANYIATLVSGGEHYKTRLLKSVKAYDNSEVVAVGAEAPLNIVEMEESSLNAVKKGMIVGNHGYSHEAFSSLSLEDGIKDIEKCENMLDKLYADSGVRRKFRPFRFPYGDKGGENREGFQKSLKENGFHKLDDRAVSYPWWRESRLSTDIDTFWTFDFAEYNLGKDPHFTKETVWQRMHDPNPQQGAALFAPNNRHILLLHAHDSSEELLPGYCRLFIDHLIENGVVFDEPRFIGKE